MRKGRKGFVGAEYATPHVNPSPTPRYLRWNEHADVVSSSLLQSLIQAAKKIINKEGISGLYAGLDSSLLGIGVTNFIYYYFFERCRDALLKSKQKVAAAAASTATATIAAGGALTTGESMLAGLIAGVATSLLSNPIWVINTRQTVRSAPKEAEGPAAKGKPVVVKKMSFIQTLQHVVKTDGITALWKGIGPALVLVINPILQVSRACVHLRALPC